MEDPAAVPRLGGADLDDPCCLSLPLFGFGFVDRLIVFVQVSGTLCLLTKGGTGDFYIESFTFREIWFSKCPLAVGSR